MAIKINSKIVGWQVEAKSIAGVEQAGPMVAPVAEVVEMHEKIKRPDQLHGTTYKVKSPNSENALYIVVNDIILNEGTEHERRQPFEVFINSRDMSNYQWVSALTLVISAVFRKGGDVTFLIDELKQVFDPTGGYFKGGRFVPSLVAEIGMVIERHMISIGLLQEVGLDKHQAAFLEQKKQQLASGVAEAGGFPASSSLCNKCHTKAVVFADGCETCLSCGASKCS